MPSRTFDAWLAYSNDFSTKRDVSGKYGVDFRVPEPCDAHRRALRLLAEAKEWGPRMVRVNGEQFDYLDNVKPTEAQPQPHTHSHLHVYTSSSSSGTDSETDHSTTPRAASELDNELELDDWLHSDYGISSPVLPGHAPAPVPMSPESQSPMSPVSVSAQAPNQIYLPNRTTNTAAPPPSNLPHSRLSNQPVTFSSMHAPASATLASTNSSTNTNSGMTRLRSPSEPSRPTNTNPSLHAFAFTSSNTNVGTGASGQSSQPAGNVLRPAYARRGSVASAGAGDLTRHSEPSRQGVNTTTNSNNAFATGPYGYHYPVHPPYAPSSSSSSSDLSSSAGFYGPNGGRVGGSSRRLEWTEPWDSARGTAVMDSAGGWGRVSDPLPMPGIGPGEQERVNHQQQQQQQRVYPTSLPNPGHTIPLQSQYYGDMNPSHSHGGQAKQAVGPGYWRTSDLRNPA